MALRFFAAIYSFSLLRELLRLEVLLEGNCEYGSLEHCGLNHRGFLSSNSGIIEKKYIIRYPKKQKLCESHHCSTGLTTISLLEQKPQHDKTETYLRHQRYILRKNCYRREKLLSLGLFRPSPVIFR